MRRSSRARAVGDRVDSAIRIGGALAATIALTALVARASTRTAPCTTTEAPGYASPDGAYTATVRYDRCEGDVAFESYAGYGVTLRSAGAPSRSEVVFSTSGFSSDDAPSLTWLGRRTLRIRGTWDGFGSRETSFGDVTIRYAGPVRLGAASARRGSSRTMPPRAATAPPTPVPTPVPTPRRTPPPAATTDAISHER